MTSYRRDETSSRAHAKKNRRNRSGQTRGFHQDQDQVNSHSGIPGNQYTSDYHGDVPPSPASSAPAVAPGVRLGADHNPSELERASTRYLPHRKWTAQWRYVTREPPASSNVRDTSVCFTRCSCTCCQPSNNAAQIASGAGSRAPKPSVAYFHGAVPAKGTCAAIAVPLHPGPISTKGTRASCAVPIGHGPSSATGPELTAPFPSAAA